MLTRCIELAASDKISKSFLLGCIIKRASDDVLVYSLNGHSEFPNASSHAEARALRKANKGSVLWVGRCLRDKKTWAMSKPCITCSTQIINAGIHKVIYTIGPNNYGIWYP